MEKGPKVTLPYPTTFLPYPCGPLKGTGRHYGITTELRPDTLATTNDTFTITPYTSSPSVRPDAVRRIYERAPSARHEKWFEGIRLSFERAITLYISGYIFWLISDGTFLAEIISDQNTLSLWCHRDAI
jgi:hypothetical protein